MTQPPETTQRPEGGTGGGLTSKLGPLPVWGWVAIAAAGGVVLLLWLQSRKNAAAAATPAPNVIGPDTAEVQNLQDQFGVISSQIRNLQGGGSVATSNSPSTSNVLAGWSVYQYLSDLNDQLQQQGNPLRVTYAQLLALNPGLANNINNSDPAKPTFKQSATINIQPVRAS